MDTGTILLAILGIIIAMAQASFWFIIKDLKDSITRQDEALHAFKAEVYRDYIKEDRLTRVEESIKVLLSDYEDRNRRILEDIKSDIRNLYSRLERRIPPNYPNYPHTNQPVQHSQD